MPFARVFLDDILIFSKDESDHQQHVETVINTITYNGGTINNSKSKFYLREVTYLGVSISSEGLKPVYQGKFELNLLTPVTTKKQLQRLIGVINWFRPFLPNLSSQLAPVTFLLQGKESIKWMSLHQTIIEEINQMINQQPTLAHPNYKTPFYLQYDASDFGIGGVLFQEGMVVGYFSKKLNTAQRNYPIIEKEGLVIHLSLQHFRPIIYGAKIIVETDHSNLLYDKQAGSQRIQRWSLFLAEYTWT